MKLLTVTALMLSPSSEGIKRDYHRTFPGLDLLDATGLLLSNNYARLLKNDCMQFKLKIFIVDLFKRKFVMTL